MRPEQKKKPVTYVSGQNCYLCARLLRGEDRELVQVLDGLRKNKTPRRIAEDIWGKARVAAEWNSDSWMRSQVRRWIPKARALADGGWRDLAPRYVPEE